MHLSDMLRSPLITDDNWKRKLAGRFQEIEQIGSDAMKQAVHQTAGFQLDDGKTECIHYCGNKNENIVTSYYNKATGNREKIEFPELHIIVQLHFDKNVRNSEQYLDCSAIDVFDGRPDTEIMRVMLFLNGDGTMSYGIHILNICFNGKEVQAFYNADGVLQPNGLSKGFNDAENRKITLFNQKHRL